MPAVYAIFAAAAVRIGGIALEQTFLWPVLSHFTGAFIILTTITAGAQLHRTPIGRPDLFTIGTSINKLFLSPLIAFAIIMLAGVFTPVTAQVFFIYAAVPSSFSLILFAVDYNCCPHRVAKSILYSSAFGLVTLTCDQAIPDEVFFVGRVDVTPANHHRQYSAPSNLCSYRLLHGQALPARRQFSDQTDLLHHSSLFYFLQHLCGKD